MSPDTQQQPGYPNQPQVMPPQAPNGIPPSQQQVSQPPMPPTSSQVPSYESGEDAKISSPKYWLTVYGIFVLYNLLGGIDVHQKIKIISLVVFIAWLVLLIFCYRNVSKVKASGQDVLTKEEKFKMVFFMSVDPVIAQAFFYYRLKKVLPQTAKTALKIGWKVFFLQVLPTFAIIIVGFLVIAGLIAIPSLQKNSWYNSNNSKFSSSAQSVSNDVSAIEQDVQSQKATSLQTDCQQLKTDVTSLQQIPAYPVSSTSAKITKAENELAMGATDCLNGISRQNTNLINQAGNELLSGINNLNSVHSAVTTK